MTGLGCSLLLEGPMQDITWSTQSPHVSREKGEEDEGRPIDFVPVSEGFAYLAVYVLECSSTLFDPVTQVLTVVCGAFFCCTLLLPFLFADSTPAGLHHI